MDPNTEQNNQQPTTENPNNNVVGADISGSAPPPQPIQPTPEQSPVKPPSGGNKKLLIITIVVIVALGILGAAGFALMNSSGETPENHTTNNNTENNNTANTTNSTTETPANSDDVKSGQVAVSITNFTFSPSTLKVKKGTVVTWTNSDSVGHTVTSDTDSEQKGLASSLLEQGKTYSFTFDKVGMYKYHCQPHPNMTASVEVVE